MMQILKHKIVDKPQNHLFMLLAVIFIATIFITNEHSLVSYTKILIFYLCLGLMIVLTNKYVSGYSTREKNKLIESIKRIITYDVGETTAGELELTSSPVLYARGDVMFLIEDFGVDEIEYVVYHDEVVISSGKASYQELDYETLLEIYEALKNYRELIVE